MSVFVLPLLGVFSRNPVDTGYRKPPEKIPEKSTVCQKNHNKGAHAYTRVSSTTGCFASTSASSNAYQMPIFPVPAPKIASFSHIICHTIFTCLVFKANNEGKTIFARMVAIEGT